MPGGRFAEIRKPFRAYLRFLLCKIFNRAIDILSIGAKIIIEMSFAPLYRGGVRSPNDRQTILICLIVSFLRSNL